MRLPDPADPATFQRSKLDLSEREKHAEAYRMSRDLLRLRREDPVLKSLRRVDGAVLNNEAFVVRFFGAEDDRLLVINLGRDLHLTRISEPLLAPPAGGSWETRWSSEDPKYGGFGAPPLETADGWSILGHAAFWLAPR